MMVNGNGKAATEEEKDRPLLEALLWNKGHYTIRIRCPKRQFVSDIRNPN